MTGNVNSFQTGVGGTGLIVGSNLASKKKTVSPRNVNTAFPHEGSAGRSGMVADEQQ
jgi:hypothetical protein